MAHGLARAQREDRCPRKLEVVVYEKRTSGYQSWPASCKGKVRLTRTDESSFQQYPIHIAPVRRHPLPCPARRLGSADMQDGRSALAALLSEATHAQLIDESSHGIKDGGISLFTPSGIVLFSLKRYEGEQPQFVHRHVLKRVLEQREDVTVRRGVGVESVSEYEEGRAGNGTVSGPISVKRSNGKHVVADLIVGA